jgi:hypothetical protein
MQPSQLQQMQKLYGASAGAVPGAVPGGNQFQFFPIQVGGPTPYARKRKLPFIGIAVYQLLMAIMALVEFQNFLSGIIMIIACCCAALAVKEDMNITYLCWFGVLSTAGFIAGLVGALIGFAVKLSTIIVKFNIPLSCFFSMILAWWLYSDYEEEHPESNDMVASWLRAFGLLKAKQMPPPVASSNPFLSKGQLPMFGNADSLKDYQSQAAAQYGSYRDQAFAQAGKYGAMGNDQFATAQAKAQEGGYAASGWLKAAEGAAVSGAAAGKRDVVRDPFLTQ